VTRHPGRDAGYSLVEMLVTIIMFTLVAGSITTVVITTMKHQNSLAERGSVLAATRNSLEQVERDIRSANPLCAASSTSITMLENDPNTSVTSIVNYQVSGTNLVYSKYNTVSVVGPSATCTVQTYDSDGNPNPPDYYNATSPVVSGKKILSNMVASSTAVFSIPSPPTGKTFNDCAAGGTTPGAVTGISVLAVNVSVQPQTLSSPVAFSDCGTYLRNYVVP
jgi:type II secretory pathway pseudopilin PulG